MVARPHGALGVFCRRQMAQRAMRTKVVIVLPPGLKFNPHIVEGEKQADVQAFVPEPPVEAFDESVFNWPAGADKVEFDPRSIGPCVDGSAAKLRTIVQRDR